MISRDLLEKYFAADPRLIAEFEEQAAAVEDTTGTAAAAVEATNALKDAFVVVLSPNSEFTNERVLEVGSGIQVTVTAEKVRISVKDVARTQDYSVILIPTGDTELLLPPTGTLLSDQSVPTLVNALNDAAAAAAGVGIGRMYRNGSALMVRVT